MILDKLMIKRLQNTLILVTLAKVSKVYTKSIKNEIIVDVYKNILYLSGDSDSKLSLMFAKNIYCAPLLGIPNTRFSNHSSDAFINPMGALDIVLTLPFTLAALLVDVLTWSTT